MEKYINSIEKSKDYYISLALEYSGLFETRLDYFVFVNCVINRAMNINRGFISLTKDNNYTCAIPLMRMMIDNCLRLWGITLVDNTHDYIRVWINGEKIASLKAKNGKKLTDSYLSKEFDILYHGIDKTYKNACAFVHLSDQSLFMTAKRGDGIKRIDMHINGYDNLSDDVKCNIDKWMLYFNNVFIDIIRSIFPRNNK